MERAELAQILGRARPASSAHTSPPRCIIESEPRAFMDAFAEAVAGAGDILLGDPRWGAHEREQLAAILAKAPPAATTGWLALPTGGSSGQLKFARHDAQTIAAAVAGFQKHFAVERVQTVGVLPLHHVSGFMAWMRCAISGGVYQPWDWKKLEDGNLPDLPRGDWFISLVPTQLSRLLKQPRAAEWLRRFRAVFLGGAPAWPDLLDAAAAAYLPISLSYGMTETAAMVAALRPDEFLQGHRSVGTPLPHAKLEIMSTGVVAVRAGSLCHGYYPEQCALATWQTEDLGHFDATGHLHIEGRRDAIIITGGKKVSPTEVENALRSTGVFTDVAVIGLPDPEWGEIVVACYPRQATDRAITPAAIGAQLGPLLAHYKCPKLYLPLANWPRNAQGKLQRPALVTAAQLQRAALAGAGGGAA